MHPTGFPIGVPHNDIPPTGRRAHYTASVSAMLDSGEKPRIRKLLRVLGVIQFAV